MDPKLSLIGDEIPFVGREPVHFLGGTIQIPSSQQLAKDHIFKKYHVYLVELMLHPLPENKSSVFIDWEFASVSLET